MKILQKLVLLSIFLVVAFNNSFAQETEKKQSPFRFLIKGGFEFGGEEVVEILFEDGSKQSLKAGEGGTIAVGAQYQIPTLKRLLFHATAGYKYVTTKADNAHIRMTRVPISVTANWMATRKLRFGAGLASHQAINFKGDNIVNDLSFSSASGPVVELAYSFLGVTYTGMTYKDELNNKYSANAIGVSLTFSLPK